MIYRKAKTKDAKEIAEVLLKNYNIKDKQEALIIAKQEEESLLLTKRIPLLKIL